LIRVIERPIDLKSVQSAWQGLNKLVPLGPITNAKDYELRVGVMDELLDRIGANESHRLMPLLDIITRQIEAYEAQHHALPDAPPAVVLAYLMEEKGIK
jgi:antitoxin component HigA of HigAB toxin-antitoxin module